MLHLGVGIRFLSPCFGWRTSPFASQVGSMLVLSGACACLVLALLVLALLPCATVSKRLLASHSNSLDQGRHHTSGDKGG
jgi:hypothetical protein